MIHSATCPSGHHATATTGAATFEASSGTQGSTLGARLEAGAKQCSGGTMSAVPQLLQNLSRSAPVAEAAVAAQDPAAAAAIAPSFNRDVEALQGWQGRDTRVDGGHQSDIMAQLLTLKQMLEALKALFEG